MKHIITIILLTFGVGLINAQTAKIAFKSHGGNMNDFFTTLDMDSDFGLPPKIIKKIIKTSDTTVVEIGEQMGKKLIDTVVNHPYCHNPNIDLDSLKKMYPASTKFEGFKETPKKNKTKQIRQKKQAKKSTNVKKQKQKKAKHSSTNQERVEQELVYVEKKQENKTWMLWAFLPLAIGGLTWVNLKTTDS